MFGFSFGELLVICVVALIAVGPKKLPGMLHTLGMWIRKLRNMTTDVRKQTGIDELLRAEGLHGGLNELRGLLRVNLNHDLSFDSPRATTPAATHVPDPTPVSVAHAEDPYFVGENDESREYPQEGADSYGALPDDLLDDTPIANAAEAPATETIATAAPDAAPAPAPAPAPSDAAPAAADAPPAPADAAPAAPDAPPAPAPADPAPAAPDAPPAPAPADAAPAAPDAPPAPVPSESA